MAISAKVRTTPVSTAPPRASAPPPIGPTTPAVRESAREGSRAYWLDRAARDRKRAGANPKARFAIQLELACEIGSLVDAWKHDQPAGTMWLLDTPFQGRTCFRVLWGRYPNRDAARRALSSVPAFFATPRNRPIVTAIH
jgi:septal ring-binding cell division protein DamX